MGLVYCRDCQHIRKPTGAPYEPHPESICMEVIVKIDNVTGEAYHEKCKYVNLFGECKWFLSKDPKGEI